MEKQSSWDAFFSKISEETKQKANDAVADCKSQEEVNKIIEKVTDDVSKSLCADLKKSENTILKVKEKQRSSFNKRLCKLWRKPLDLLNLFLILSEEIGRSYNERFRTEKAKQNDIVLDVLIRLHAHSSLISREIFTLLCNGYASGAEARWRSLYETTVIVFFIAEHDRDVAEKYLLHEKIETYKGMEQYNKYAEKLNGNPFSEKEVKQAKEIKDNLCKKYGESFAYDYGWAASELKKEKPNFSDLEESICLYYWRPYYKMASHSVHPSAKSLSFTLGLKNMGNIMLAGPSNADLEKPGCRTAISISQINSVLLTREPDYLNLVVAKILLYLSEEIQQEFLIAAQSIGEQVIH